MIGKRRFLIGLTFTLCFVAQAEADSIPFDYWYGRIIGRTQIQSIHDAFNDERGTLTTSLKTGYGEAVSINLGSLFEIGPTSESNVFELEFLRPQLSAVVGLGPRMRLNIDNLDWREDSEVSVSQSGYSQYSSSANSRFETGQTLSMLHEDIEYSPERSLYMYKSGMFLQPRNWKFDVSLAITVKDSEMLLARESRMSGQTVIPRYQRKIIDDGRDWLLGPTIGYGVSQRLQITTGLVIGRGTQPFSVDELRGTSDLPDTLLLRSFSDMDRSSRIYGAFVHPVFLLSENHWAYLRASVNTSRTASDARGHNESELTVTSNYRDISSRKIDSYSLSIGHTWISKKAPILRQQILDDNAQYYGRRLAPGTLQVNSLVSASFCRTYLDQSTQNNALPIRSRSSWSKSDQLVFLSQATYYSRFKLDFKLQLQLIRSSNGTSTNDVADRYEQSESYGCSFGIGYYSFRWSPEKRRSISWDQINDIDYLYGPLLRTLDWKASVSVMPPTHKWSAVSADGNIFSFYKGESDNRWSTVFSAAIGLSDGIEAGFGVRYFQEQYSAVRVIDESIWSLYQNDTWILTPQVRWQPGERFRVDFTAKETYANSDRLFHLAGREELSHAYSHTWEIRVVYTILI